MTDKMVLLVEIDKIINKVNSLMPFYRKKNEDFKWARIFNKRYLGEYEY